MKLALLLVMGLSLSAAESQTYKPESIRVYFSPNGGAAEAVVAAIRVAKKSIHVQAYSFTSAPIAGALTDAKKRGVAVEAILDKGQRTANYSEADFISRASIPTFIDAKHAIAHNKIILIDGAVVITGSFNFTKAAESSNAENLLVIRDTALAARYLKNWQEHRKHSEPFTR